MKGVVNLNRNLGLVDRFIPTDATQRDPAAYAQSYKDFMEVVNQYPDTPYARDARQRAVYLHNSLAMHEIHIADYYMDRGAYLAAAKRAAGVIENYQRTPAARRALEIMIEAYKKLVSDHSSSPLLADAYYALGTTQQELGKSADAASTFQTICSRRSRTWGPRRSLKAPSSSSSTDRPRRHRTRRSSSTTTDPAVPQRRTPSPR